ncbi:MAG: MATE family efflux transporter, partial [Pseudomonadota bacterium]
IAWRFQWGESDEDLLETAVEHAQRAVQIDPVDPVCEAQLGFVAFWAREHGRAIHCFELAVQMDPGNSDTISDLGMAYSYLGRSDEAIPLLQQSLEQDPTSPDDRLWSLGDAGFASGDYPLAVEALAAMRIYIETRLLGAPFAVAFFAGVGWLTGQGRMALMMAVVIFMTFINAVLDVYFALMLEMGAQGIALGTALAEGSGAILMGLGILWVLHKRGGLKQNWIPARMRENLRGVLSLNADIFLRTFCLALVFAYFTRAGGQFGDLTLAANQVLMHIVMVASLLLDGPAIAAETLVGKALGRRQEKRRASFYEAVTTTSLIGGVGALTMAMGLLFFHETIIGLVVPQGEANADLFKEALKYVPWAIIFPLILFLPFQIDGIYIGATRGRALRNSMVIAAALFAAAIFLGVPALGNHGLWLAFSVFMLGRGLTLLAMWKGFTPLISPSPIASKA